MLSTGGLVGFALVGWPVAGDDGLKDGARVGNAVGDAVVVGEADVGDAVVGEADVGDAVVGEADVGDAVIVGNAVGAAVGVRGAVGYETEGSTAVYTKPPCSYEMEQSPEVAEHTTSYEDIEEFAILMTACVVHVAPVS